MTITALDPKTALVLIDLQNGILAQLLVANLDAQERDIRVTKHNWGAFHGTDLDTRLRRRGITEIVLGGVRTSIGVESTACEALKGP
jgi:nicotinamidase-related amidase